MDKRMKVIRLGLVLAATLLLSGVAPLQATGAPRAHGSSFNGQAIVRTALRYLGYRYTPGGTRPRTGFDNVGFVRYVYAQHGIHLPPGLSALHSAAQRRHLTGLHLGHLVFFKDVVMSYTPPQSHVGIYIGRGLFVHAYGDGLGVIKTYFFGDPLGGDYWAEHYDGKVSRKTIPHGPGSLRPKPSKTPVQCMKPPSECP